MSVLLTLIYREFCLARLAEMGKASSELDDRKAAANDETDRDNFDAAGPARPTWTGTGIIGVTRHVAGG